MPAIRTKSQLATAASPAAFPVSPAATTTWLSAALGALAALALAVPAGAQTMHRSPHEEETANIVGPNVSILISPEKTITRFGILATAGSYFWFRESPWGLDLEVVYLLLFDSDLVHELAVEFGPVFRF